MKNKVIKTIIKIYFLIENAEHSGCLNHTLHPLLCQISLRGKDSNCVLDIHPVYPLEHRELEGCAQQVPRDRSPMPAPSISRCPLLTPLFKSSVLGRFKLLLETFFFQGSHSEEPCCLLVELISHLPFRPKQHRSLEPTACGQKNPEGELNVSL